MEATVVGKKATGLRPVLPVAVFALGLLIMEPVFVVTDSEGRQIGDGTGDTRVIEVGDGML